MMIKFCFLVNAAVFFLSPLVGAWQVRKLEDLSDSSLSDSSSSGSGQWWELLISEASPKDEPLCITFVDNNNAAASLRNNLKLTPCDFDLFTGEQLWLYQDGKFIKSQTDESTYCLLHIGQEQIFDGVSALARVEDCTDFASKEWIYDGQYIKLAFNESYCLTNRGQNANVGDTLHTKPCLDRPDFKWSHTSYDPRSLYQFYADGGCIATKNDSMDKFTNLILGDCAGPSSTWNVVHTNGVKIFRNGLDKSMCMQAGLGGYVSHGTVLRLMPCNDKEYLQKFQWDDETPIKLSSNDFNDDVCVEFRGSNVNAGVDPVIMKSCDSLVYEGWSADQA